METSGPEEKGQHKFVGILLCSMGLNGDTKVLSFENLSYFNDVMADGWSQKRYSHSNVRFQSREGECPPLTLPPSQRMYNTDNGTQYLKNSSLFLSWEWVLS